jgi:hypothetical protein
VTAQWRCKVADFDTARLHDNFMTFQNKVSVRVVLCDLLTCAHCSWLARLRTWHQSCSQVRRCKRVHGVHHARAGAEFTDKSDVYSIAIVLHELMVRVVVGEHQASVVCVLVARAIMFDLCAQRPYAGVAVPNLPGTR